jgi:hypothetical protein
MQLFKKVGLVGVWQGGWVNAKAVEQNSEKIDFVINLTSTNISTLRELDNHNTKADMKCKSNYTESQILNVQTQRKYFYDFIENTSLAKKLDDYTKSILQDTTLKEWLHPTSDKIDLKNKSHWYTVFESSFNPFDVWKNFNKPVFMQYNEFEDYPLSSELKSRVDKHKKKNIRTVLIPNAQHGGFYQTTSSCNNDFGHLTKYHEDYFAKMKAWLKTF